MYDDDIADTVFIYMHRCILCIVLSFIRDMDLFGGHLDAISRQAEKKLVMPPLERSRPRGEGVP